MNVKTTNNFVDKLNHQINANFTTDIERIQEIIEEMTNKVEKMRTPNKFVFDSDFDLANEVKNFEIGLIELALKVAKGNQTRALKLLGIKKSTLNAKIKRYNIGLTKV